MDDVIDNCQVTFEEDGINQQTLNDMKTVGLSFSFLTASLWIKFSQIPVSSIETQLLGFASETVCYRICASWSISLCCAGRAQSFGFGWAEAGECGNSLILGGLPTL